MRLRLINGYPYPFPEGLSEAEQDELAALASEQEIVLNGVTHFEWLHIVTVEFVDWLMHDKAFEQTAWFTWSAKVLEAPTSSADGYGHPAIIVGDRAYCGFILESDK